jgi:hypothetical protein
VTLAMNAPMQVSSSNSLISLAMTSSPGAAPAKPQLGSRNFGSATTCGPTKGFFEGTKRMCSMVQVGLNYRFGLQPTEDAAQNGDDLRRDPLEVRKTARARRSYFRDVATGAFIFR